MRTSELKLLTAIVCCLVTLSISAADINFKSLSIVQAISEAEMQNKHLFITYEADWCLPCQIMEETVFTNESVVSKLNTDFVSIKVNFDEVSDKEWFGTYAVSSLPTLSIVDDTGKELIRQEGTMNLTTFLAFLDSNTKQTNTAEKRPRIAPPHKNIPSTTPITIQFGAFSTFTNAEKQQQYIENLLSLPTIIRMDDTGLYKLHYTQSITREERGVIIASAKQAEIDFFIK